MKILISAIFHQTVLVGINQVTRKNLIYKHNLWKSKLKSVFLINILSETTVVNWNLSRNSSFLLLFIKPAETHSEPSLTSQMESSTVFVESSILDV